MYEKVLKKIKNVEINNTNWEYYDNESTSKNTIICLPSTTNKAHVFYEYGETLKDKFRLISISYPDDTELIDFMNDFKIMLDHLNIDDFYLLGYEHGGMIAQILLGSFQDRISGLVLIHSGTKTGKINKNIVKSHRKNLKKIIKSHKVFIKWLFRNKYKRSIKKAFNKLEVENKEKYKNFYLSLFMDTDIESLSNIYKLLLSIWDSEATFENLFNKWGNKAIIIESKYERDKDIDEKNQITEIFSNYEEIIIDGKKTLSLIKNKNEFISILNNLA